MNYGNIYCHMPYVWGNVLAPYIGWLPVTVAQGYHEAGVSATDVQRITTLMQMYELGPEQSPLVQTVPIGIHHAIHIEMVGLRGLASSQVWHEPGQEVACKALWKAGILGFGAKTGCRHVDLQNSIWETHQGEPVRVCKREELREHCPETALRFERQENELDQDVLREMLYPKAKLMQSKYGDIKLALPGTRFKTWDDQLYASGDHRDGRGALPGRDTEAFCEDPTSSRTIRFTVKEMAGDNTTRGENRKSLDLVSASGSMTCLSGPGMVQNACQTPPRSLPTGTATQSCSNTTS